MPVIYEPRGLAREYAPLALNLYGGCEHRCRYCYAPRMLRRGPEAYFTDPAPRHHMMAALETEAKRLGDAGDQREILLSFIGDPLQGAELDHGLTGKAIEILMKNDLAFTLLTKAGLTLLTASVVAGMAGYAKARLGVSLTSMNTNFANYWEPEAATPSQRLNLLSAAHSSGLRTWISLEPVLRAECALGVLKMAPTWVDVIRIGKINHMPDVEKKTDWPAFVRWAEQVAANRGLNVVFKENLAPFTARGGHDGMGR